MRDPASITRRIALLAGAALSCGPHRLARADMSVARIPPASVPPANVTEVAPGIHVRTGLTEDATRANDDAIANTSFIIGGTAVAVFDPGGSLADGHSLRGAIRARSTLPIRYVILSHDHPDHIFGAGAFTDDNPTVIGHANLPAELAARGDYYRRQLDAILGPGRAGPVIAPTLLVRDRLEIDLGGRILALTAHPPAHTDCDVTAFDRQTRTLLAGDLLFVHRIPALDGNLQGWLRQLAALERLDATHAVPGHGPAIVAWPGAAADLRRYLATLLRETRAAIARNVPIDQAATTVAASERPHWALFDAYNPRNVLEAYKQLEWE